MRKQYSFEVCGVTDTGLVRNNNEDSYWINKEMGLFMVADGLGGHAAGETASRLAVNVIAGYLKQRFEEKPQENITQSINKAMRQAHETVLRESVVEPSFKGMGTTIVTALFKGYHDLYIANVGDSRAYLYRQGKLLLLSQDHSLAAELVSRGLITEQEARTYPQRNIVTQAIGVEPLTKCFQRRLFFRAKDILLLCSDGLWDMIPEKEIREIISKRSKFRQLCQSLIDAAKAAGGKDNITVIVIEIKENICMTKFWKN